MHHETLDGREIRTPGRTIRLGLAALLVLLLPLAMASSGDTILNSPP
jgi:hypothetical protein